MFDAIIVMNDRKQLDEQLGETVIEFLREHNITDVKRSNSSLNLSCLILERSARVIITTLQKFAKLLKPEFISKRRIAIIADEAHRTHVHHCEHHTCEHTQYHTITNKKRRRMRM